MTTFHGLALRLLAEHPERAGLPPGFRVADEAARLEAATRVTGSERPACAFSPPWAAAAPRRGPTAERAALQAELRAELLRRGLVDVDELTGLAVQLLGDEAAAAALRDRWPWISVDEYQDLDEQQYQLLRLLTGDGAGLP